MYSQEEMSCHVFKHNCWPFPRKRIHFFPDLWTIQFMYSYFVTLGLKMIKYNRSGNEKVPRARLNKHSGCGHPWLEINVAWFWTNVLKFLRKPSLSTYLCWSLCFILKIVFSVLMPVLQMSPIPSCHPLPQLHVLCIIIYCMYVNSFNSLNILLQNVLLFSDNGERQWEVKQITKHCIPSRWPCG